MFFLEFSCFFYDPADVGNLISGSSAFSKSSFNICNFSVHVLLKASLENFEPLSRSNCCFLTYTQVSQEAGKVLWYSHLFKDFPQFVVIHIVKGFGVVNEAEVDVFSGILLLFI